MANFIDFLIILFYNHNMKIYDVVIIGAGAAGLTAAAAATERNKSVAIIDMGKTPARKVMASGGGRCNFTNINVNVNRYFGNNPDFVRSAITRINPQDILNWAKKHNITWVEKNPGQYFSETGAADIVKAIIKDASKADFFLETQVLDTKIQSNLFHITTNNKTFIARSLIIATGGISFPALTVSDYGYQIAKIFGHKIIPVRPALCAIATQIFPKNLAGISLKVGISIGHEKFIDSMLFTHFGLGGPAIYRATVRDITDIRINLMPEVNVYDFLKDAKTTSGKKKVSSILSEKLPIKLAKLFCPDDKNIADYKDAELRHIADTIHDIIIPYQKIKLFSLKSAEVVRGGVDVTYISSKTMESKLQPGLFFAGEVLDIAGDLGGFNLHWAWASGHIAGENA